jgi:nicotinamide mononucleotide transporter
MGSLVQALRALFSADFIILSLPFYKMSLCELLGTASGLACVAMAARAKVSSWPLGLANALFFFALFFQVRLYSDMFLQVFFMVSTVFGWWRWVHPRTEAETDRRSELKVSDLRWKQRAWILAASLMLSIGAGFLTSRLDRLLPALFPEPAAFPYADALTTVFSVTAQILMAQKKRDCWPLWLGLDAIDAVIYAMKGVWLVSAEYLVFGMIAASGWIAWTKIVRSYDGEAADASAAAKGSLGSANA